MDYAIGTAEMEDALNEAREWHPELKQARIAVISREKAPRINKMTVFADVSKPSARMLPLLNAECDYVICISEDKWYDMTHAKRLALLDHELCHCVAKGDKWALRGHDMEEFVDVVSRHGMWRQTMAEEAMRQAMVKQPELFDRAAEN